MIFAPNNLSIWSLRYWWHIKNMVISISICKILTSLSNVLKKK